MTSDNSDSVISWIGHVLSIGTVASSLVGLLPPIAAAATLIWVSVQIYESKTFQRWIERRNRAKLVRLHAKTSALEIRLSEASDEASVDRLKAMFALRVETDAAIKLGAEKKEKTEEAK